MKRCKIFTALSVVCVFVLSAFLAACGSAPFARRFTGVVGSYDGSGNPVAVMLFPESEQAEGRINLTNAPESNIEFRYTVSAEGEISFDFDTEDAATGTLHGKDISVTAHVNGQTLAFSGTFYLLTVKIDGDVTEEGYVTAGHPFSDVVPLPEEVKTITVNGAEMTVEKFEASKMPEKDTTVEIVTAE